MDFTYSIDRIQEPPVSRQSQIDFLEGFLQVSIKKANDLLSHFHTPQNITNALLESEIILTKTEKKKLTGPFAKIKGYGLKFVEKNQDLLTQQINVKSNKSRQSTLM